MIRDDLPDEILSRFDDEADDESSDSADHELLVDHARAVAERTRRFGRFADEPAGPGDSGPTDAAIARCLGWLHDFGKVAPTFQLHVRGDYPSRRPRQYTYHARLGAFATYYALGELDATERDRLAAWSAVLRHHGGLPDVAERTIHTVQEERDDDRQTNWASVQVGHVQSHHPSREVAATLVETATDGAASWTGFVDAFESGALFDELLDAVAEGRSRTSAASDALPDGLYDRTTRLWSSLTLADKTAAGGVETGALVPKPLEIDELDAHVESLQRESGTPDVDVDALDPTDEASLNVLREAARRRVRANAPQLADAEVGTLTLPTGLGKTFAGITGAFELRDALAERRDRETKPTVVYALPYTSIIEQTREIFEDEDVFDADPRTSEFTVHHYLSETVTYADAEQDVTDGEPETDAYHSAAELLGESWRSGVVLTTFVQLFESLAGPTNARGLKLPALRDAVVVLDEPQALPLRWWDAIRRLTRLLVDEYDAHVVSMTATQPTLFTQGEFDTRSLLTPPAGASGTELRPSGPDPSGRSFERRASDAVARVRYDVHESVRTVAPTDGGTPISHAAAASEIVDATRGPPDGSADGRSVLAVCNTVGSSRELTDRVETAFREAGHPPTNVGTAYADVLSEVDTDVDELPDHEVLAHRTLRKLGLDDEGNAEEWSPGDDYAGQRYVATFNSQYRPLDRRVLVHVADALSTASVPFVLVSTQAIEAGVDVSFARAYRDVAPLDSVVQTAGRCNRSFEWGPENGDVTVWTLGPVEDDESDTDRKPPSNYVYDGALLSSAADILLDCCDGEPGTLSSVTLEHDAVPRYFEAVESQSKANEELVEMIEESRAETLGRRSLVHENYETVDLVVAVTETDDRRLNRLGDAFEGHPSEGFDRLSELADLRVSIPLRDLEESLPMHVRADRSSRTNADGVNVFVHYSDEEYGAYKLAGGGFVADDDDGLSGRFTH